MDHRIFVWKLGDSRNDTLMHFNPEYPALTLVGREDVFQSVQSVGEAAYVLREPFDVVVTKQRVDAVVADAAERVTLGHPQGRHHGGVEAEA